MNETQHPTSTYQIAEDGFLRKNWWGWIDELFDYRYDAAPTAFGVRLLARQFAVSAAD